jgi:hypothetical protein
MIDISDKLKETLARLERTHPAPRRKAGRPTNEEIEQTSKLELSDPAPHIQAMVEARGPELTQQAINAWEMRRRGELPIDIANALHVSIETARALIREACDAVKEDLKENVELHKQLDLERIDSLVKTYLPSATRGDLDSAHLVLKAIGTRAKVLGQDKAPDPARGQQAPLVLAWIQNQLPAINRIVDSLPIE